MKSAPLLVGVLPMLLPWPAGVNVEVAVYAQEAQAAGGLALGLGVFPALFAPHLRQHCSVFDRGPSRARSNIKRDAPRPDAFRSAVARSAGQALDA